MFQVEQNSFQASGIRRISGKSPVEYGHMAAKGIYDNFYCLLKGKPFFVLIPADIRQGVFFVHRNTLCGARLLFTC